MRTFGKKIKLNSAKCNKCGEVLISRFTHDFQTCSCGKVSVDGGKDYLKRSAMLKSDYIELTEYEEEIKKEP